MTRVLVRDCVIAAAEVWGVTPMMIEGRRRWGAVVEARQAAMALAAALSWQAEAEIARRIGRDPSTVRRGIAWAARRRGEDLVFRAALERAERLALALAEARRVS